MSTPRASTRGRHLDQRVRQAAARKLTASEILADLLDTGLPQWYRADLAEAFAANIASSDANRRALDEMQGGPS